MILQGDCRDRMAEMEDNSIDSIICDPPYEIGFMNRGWDSNGIAYDQEVWRQAWRVLKPGGTVLDPFAGSGTTLIAAKEEGFNFIGIELEPEYIEIAEARLAAAERPPATLEDFAP